jgi:hypothetical protein
MLRNASRGTWESARRRGLYRECRARGTVEEKEGQGGGAAGCRRRWGRGEVGDSSRSMQRATACRGTDLIDPKAAAETHQSEIIEPIFRWRFIILRPSASPHCPQRLRLACESAIDFDKKKLNFIKCISVLILQLEQGADADTGRGVYHFFDMCPFSFLGCSPAESMQTPSLRTSIVVAQKGFEKAAGPQPSRVSDFQFFWTTEVDLFWILQRNSLCEI